MAARLSALRAGRTLPPGFFFFLRFLVLISVRGLVDPRAIVRPEGLFEKIHLIGTRSRNLPACSVVPCPIRYRVPQRESILVIEHEWKRPLGKPKHRWSNIKIFLAEQGSGNVCSAGSVRKRHRNVRFHKTRNSLSCCATSRLSRRTLHRRV
jgi:hypothetical protein